MQIFFTSKKAAFAIIVLIFLVVFLLGFNLGNSNFNILPVIQKRLVPIYKVDMEEKKIAITLDGMWGAFYTPKILDILKANNVRVTFFFGGNWVEEYPEMLQRIAADGHEIGNHTYTHPHCNSLSPSEIKNEITKVQQIIDELVGPQPKVFRPPFGEYNNTVIQVASDLGYHTIQWSIDSLDWKEVSADYIINRVLNKVGPGDIILMHNNGKNTATALEILIPRLQEEGFELVKVSDLIYQEDYYIEQHSGIQKKLGKGN